MFEQNTFEVIIERMLERIQEDLDKREGAIIYDASAMTAKELIEMYMALDSVMYETFADTASRENLIKRASEFGVHPYLSTHARLKAVFNRDVPIGSRFSLGELNYVVLQRIVPNEYEMECEEAGVAGNENFGPLIPIEYIEGLSSAELVELLVPGEDDEETEEFRERFFITRTAFPYGGNRDDYIQKVMELQGIGAVKPFRAPLGGGTVGIVLVDSDFNIPSLALVSEIQTLIDPVVNSGEGLGIAPYGHRVTVSAAEGVMVNVETTLVLSGVTLGQLQSEIEDVINDYLLSLRKSWSKSEMTIVRKSQIEARILDINGVYDILDTKINGDEGNVTLNKVQIPTLGSVTLNG